MIRKVRIVSLFALALVLCSMLVVSTSAQRQTRIVVCNEGDRTNDTIAYPNRYERMGDEYFAPWEFAISESVGRYQLRVNSYQPFHPFYYTPDRSGEWQGRPAVGAKLMTGKDANRRMFYYWDLIDYHQRTEANGQAKVLLMVKPSQERQRITATWKTSDCKESPARTLMCHWRSEGAYNIGPPYYCTCNDGRRLSGSAGRRVCGRVNIP